MTVKAISLDIWGTLLRSDPAFKPARNEMLRAVLAPEVAADEFNRVMRECDREADEISMGRGTDVGFAERVELTLAALGSAIALTPADVDRLMHAQAELARAHHPLPLDERLPDLVAELAETRPVVLTSNTGMLPGVLMRDLLALAGFHGKVGMVFSNEVGWAKPDRRIFETAITLVEGTAGEPIASSCVVHVGDNAVADEQGARAAGMTTALVRPDGKSTVDALEHARRG
ncbi:HAD family hydrolase [Calidifontibacter indicus]|uniref:Putative hydrolase of the HAD superfamily n=1 Tax=Calidifontibacter indicus TaxID=419650 RepID=A0A3D9US85_9MICO|nr:HAD family hydrolase [Calidifontibacter indicus]REF29505.1 putative hydrolase of the HAD superfamily [Calidifontibacter indicus]